MNNWPTENLRNLGTFSKGRGISKAELVDNGLPCIRYGEIYTTHNFIVKDYKSFITTNTAQKSQKIKTGDILFAGSGETAEEIGKCVAFIDNREVYAGGDIIIFSPYKDNSIFISYYLNIIGRKQLNNLGQGNSVVHIYPKQLEKLKILVPPLKEQERIAEVLSCWDDGIEQLQKIISLKEQQKQGLMQRLLTGKVRLKGFNEKWKTIELREILNYEQPVPYIVDKIEKFSKSRIPVLTANKAFILGGTSENHGIYSKGECIIFDDFTTDLKYVDFNFKVKSSAIKILTSKNEINLKFIYEILKIIKYPLGGHKRYWISEYQYLSVCIPNVQEQSAIATILSEADNEIGLLKRKLGLFKQQKQWLMQQLLTGKRRLAC